MAAGTYLFDREGRLVASDATAVPWIATLGANASRETTTLCDLVGAARAEHFLEELIAQRSTNTVQTTLPDPMEAGMPMEVELRLMEGVDGPLLLAIIRPAVALELFSDDALTGLADRRAVDSWIATRRSDGSGARAPFALLFLDLDEFKQVNDRHGHAVGDEALIALAQRWSAAIRDGDLLTRYGGDEFVLLLNGIRTRGEAAPIVERLRQTTRAPLKVAGTAMQLSVTIGVALSELHGEQPAQLVAAADADMYSQKAGSPQHPRPK